MAMQTIERAHNAGVKVTAVSYKELCDLLIVAREDGANPAKERIDQFCSYLCELERGGYVVMLGVVPLEMMLVYGKKDFAVRYVALLKAYENGLSRKDLVFLERMEKQYASDPKLVSGIREVIAILRRKFSC